MNDSAIGRDQTNAVANGAAISLCGWRSG